jgi:presequence protease
MGTEKESFIELTERIGRKTGGLSVYPFTSSVQGNPEPVAFLMASLHPTQPACLRRSVPCCRARTVHGAFPCPSKQAVCAEQVRGKAMADKADGLLDLFHDVLLTARLDDKARFRQVRTSVVVQS